MHSMNEEEKQRRLALRGRVKTTVNIPGRPTRNNSWRDDEEILKALKGNKYRTVTELREETGLSDWVVRNAVYRLHSSGMIK